MRIADQFFPIRLALPLVGYFFLGDFFSATATLIGVTRRAGLMDFEDWHSDFGAFYRAVEWMGLQRHLKVAGIFARLTLRDGKPKYLADAPRFIGYIRQTAARYRELAPLLRLIDEIEGTTPQVGFAYGRV